MQCPSSSQLGPPPPPPLLLPLHLLFSPTSSSSYRSKVCPSRIPFQHTFVYFLLYPSSCILSLTSILLLLLPFSSCIPLNAYQYILPHFLLKQMYNFLFHIPFPRTRLYSPPPCNAFSLTSSHHSLTNFSHPSFAIHPGRLAPHSLHPSLPPYHPASSSLLEPCHTCDFETILYPLNTTPKALIR